MHTYKVNDRVSAPVVLGKPLRRYGVIIEVYRVSTNVSSRTRYAVKWDDESIERGFRREYLQKETEICSQ